MNPQCQKHKMIAKYFCLQCAEESRLCAICVKDNHSNCDDNFIVTSEILRNIDLRQSDYKISGDFHNFMKSFLKLKAGFVSEEFLKFRQRVTACLSFIEFIDEDIYSLEQINSLKKQYRTVWNKATQKVSLEPKIYTADLNINQNARSFKNQIYKSLEFFLEELIHFDLTIYEEYCNYDNFLYSKQLNTDVKLDQIKSLKITPKQLETEKILGFIKVPLENAFISIEIEKLKALPEKESSLIEIGFLEATNPIDWTKSSFDLIESKGKKFALSQSSLMNSGGNVNVSFGKKNDYLLEGKTVHFVLKPEKEIAIFDNDLTFRLSKFRDTKASYYFFFSIQHFDFAFKIGDTLF